MAAANKQHDAVSDDFDYEIWAPTTKTTLIEKQLWDVVENGVSPDPSKIPELASKIQPEELSKWRDLAVKDMKALQILQSSLTDSAFRKTLSASSAKDVWDLLEKGNEERRLRLEKEFEEVKRDDKESFDAFVDRVLGIVDQMRRLKIEKSDYEICKQIFASLPGSCDGIHSILEELMTVHKMSAASLVDFFYHNGYDFDSVTEEVLLGLLKDVRLKSESKKLCGECYMNNQDCNIMNQIYEEEEEIEVEAEYQMLMPVSLGEKTYDEDVWMMYGHATNHMTPYEKYFTTLDRTFKAKVGLMDGTLLMVEGRGAVKIRMKEGKKKTIENVIFVPGLNRNVLSVRQMTSRGCSFTSGARGEYIVHDRTGKEFGETMWDERGLSLRLQVIEGNHTS